MRRAALRDLPPQSALPMGFPDLFFRFELLDLPSKLRSLVLLAKVWQSFSRRGAEPQQSVSRGMPGGAIARGASNFCNPHSKVLSQSGRGTSNPAPLLPFWEKGLGDEGKLAELGCARSQALLFLPLLPPIATSDAILIVCLELNLPRICLKFASSLPRPDSLTPSSLHFPG
ncbi:hypothetical protein O77CONTIG1_03708 [Leptolyngbya sp. O-77]|nr:hypothetical protein O77CONTIG1_03708 [Leptolyngbya sp. O-77]